MLKFSGSVRSRPPRHGKFPSVSINNAGTIVEVHQPSRLSRAVFYQTGTISRDEVNWSAEITIDAGTLPKVAVNDDNCVVVVHEGRLLRKIYHHIGTLDGQRINWANCNGKTAHVSWGKFPAVAIYDKRVVITFDSAIGKYSTHYYLGEIDPGHNKITWRAEKGTLFHSAATETSITVNGNYVLAAGRGWSDILYQLGQFDDGVNAGIRWFNEIQFNELGFCPNVCLDNDGYVIMSWQTFTLRRLSYVTGRVQNDGDQMPTSIRWNNTKNYGFGCNPTIALRPNTGQVVEEHETNFAFRVLTSFLHYQVGLLQIDQAAEIEPPGGEIEEPGGENGIHYLHQGEQLQERNGNDRQE